MTIEDIEASLHAPIRKEPLFRAIASKLSHLNRVALGVPKPFGWTEDHRAAIESGVQNSLDHLLENYLPSGSGIDSGTKLDEKRSSSKRLVFTFGFHHMDENGFYDGWTDHEAIVTPSLESEFELRITGRNRNDIKEYLHETFWYALERAVDPYEFEGLQRLGRERYKRLEELSAQDGTKQHAV